MLFGILVLLAAVLVLASSGHRGPTDWEAASGSAAGGSRVPASGPPTPERGSSVGAGTFLYATVREAPPIELIDPDARPFSLASLRGHEVLVFFGYTHCPDVCPATIGVVGQALAAVGPGPTAVFVSIDPERDTPAWLKDYVRYLPPGFVALTGSPGQVRSVADSWGVRYARVETGSPDGYAMSHTADVYLVDADGRLRAHFPFGTEPEAMVDVMRDTTSTASGSTASPGAGMATASGPASPSPAAVAGPDGVHPVVVSTSVWAGPRSPVILTVNDDADRRVDDAALQARVQLRAPDGSAAGSSVAASPVRPPGVDRISYVAILDIPRPGSWLLDVAVIAGGAERSGSVAFTALDQGRTAALGAPVPTARTPTLDDVGGDPRAVTTDPLPDLRLSRRSTTDVLAAHVPFVLVVDSSRFRVSPVCGKAILMARYLADRWPEVAFIHLEPYVYSLVSETPVLSGDISDPPLSPIAAAWGIGDAPWGARSVPWLFVVDASGILRAKYEGLMGSDDVDIMLSFLAGDR